MTDSESRQGVWATMIAAMFWLCGWGMAVAYGHGFEFQRLVVAIPGIVMAGLVIVPGFLRRGNAWWPGMILAGVCAAYVAVRALSSPVWDLGKADLLLACLGLVSVVVGAQCSRYDRVAWVLLGGMAAVLLANGAVAALQATIDPEYGFLRADRVDREGVSGLFWHRNYLAGMLELMVPVFLAVALAFRGPAVRTGCAVLVVAGLVLAYGSQSRAGLLSVGIGCSATFLAWILSGWSDWRKRAGGGVLVAGVIGAVALMSGTLALVTKVSGQRGKSASLEAALATSDVRLAFAGLAYEQWQESPLVGTGSRTFSYEAVRNWDRSRTWNLLGNPEMAHNDYLQTLAEYGLAGFVLVVAVGGVALGRGVSQARCSGRRRTSIAAIMKLGALGGISAAMFHATVDFSLHILPNTLLAALLMGWIFAPGSDAAEGNRESAMPGGAGSFLGRGLAACMVLLAAAGSLVAGGRALLVLPQWFRFEQDLIRSGGLITPSSKASLKEIITAAPDYDLARYYGRMNLDVMFENPDARDVLLPDALWAMSLAVERHPFDGESRLNLARVLEAGGDDEGALREYLRGIEETWRREDKYGGMHALSDHLARRAEEYFLARKPDRALGLYQRARDYLEQSWELNYRIGGGPEYRKKKGFLEGRIAFLEGAGIQPAGLEDEVPAPPGD